MGVSILLSRLLETALRDRLGPFGADLFQVSRTVVISLLMASIIAWLAVHYRRQYERELEARNIELEKTQDFLSGIIRDSAEGIVTLDVEDRITSWNRAAERIFGWKAAEVVGQKVDRLLPEDPRVREDRRRAFSRIRAGETVHDHQTTRLRKDGKPIAVRLSWSPLVGPSGGYVGSTGIVLDVTAESEMRERLVERERLAAVGEMAAHVAHEIRNPLAGIRGACEVLFADGEGTSQEIGDEVLHQIDRLNRTVTDLLRFSNPRDVHATPTDLHGVIERVVALFGEAAEARGVQIERSFAAQLPPVELDPAQVEQVLYNLIVNAAQAMSYRGSIRVETALDGDDHVRIVVRDSGPGLSAEALHKAFNPFFTTRTEGTGLGLSIVKKIVAAHGGAVALANPPGGGAEVRVRLPLRSRTPEAANRGSG